MTKQEKLNCEKLTDEAIRNAKESKEEYDKYNLLEKDGSLIDAGVALRKADQTYGYAQGIYQALVCIGYKGEKMERLAGLL